MRERGDETELEVKFHPTASEDDVLHQAGELVGPEFVFTKSPPRAVFDMYLDTPSEHFYRAGISLRLRRYGTPFKHKKTFNATYKTALPGDEVGLRRRQETKTVLSPEEAREVCAGAALGRALQAAHAEVEAAGEDPTLLRPRLLLTTYSDVYLLQPREAPGEFLLLLAFDRCTAVDIAALDPTLLLELGVLDCAVRRRTARFGEAEIELMADAPHQTQAEELLDRLRGWVDEQGTGAPAGTKYTVAVDLVRAADQDAGQLVGPKADGTGGTT